MINSNDRTTVVDVGRREGSAPGNLVNLVVHLSVGYSTPVTATAYTVRAHLVDRVDEPTRSH